MPLTSKPSPSAPKIKENKPLSLAEWIGDRWTSLVVWLCWAIFVWPVRTLWRYRWEVRPALWLLPGLASSSSWLLVVCVAATVLAYRRSIMRGALRPEAREAHRSYRALCRYRDRFSRDCDALGLVVVDGERRRYPAIRASQDFGGGSWRWGIRLPLGLSADAFEAQRERLAVAFGASLVEVQRDPLNARELALTVVGSTDLLYSEALPPTPVLDMEPGRSVLAPIPIGYSATGEPVTASLWERSFLVGGSPGSGKSIAVRPLLLGAALSDCCELWLVDPKRVEFAIWRPVAARVAVGRDEAGALLDDLIAEMERRYEYMEGAGIAKLPPSEEWPLLLLAVDELADLTSAGTTKEDKQRAAHDTEQIRRLVALGRASSVVVLLATQKPASDVVPTSIRDLIAVRVGMRCGTAEQAITILGSEAVRELGAAANAIPFSARGVGYLYGEEGGKIERFRSWYLDDDTLRDQIARAAAYRGVPLEPTAGAPADEHDPDACDAPDCPACFALWNAEAVANLDEWGRDAVE